MAHLNSGLKACDAPAKIESDQVDCSQRRDSEESMAEQPVKTRTSVKKEPLKFAGYLATLLACLLTSLGVFCVKLLPVDNTIKEKAKACMIRGVFMSIFCAATVIYQGHSFKIPKGEYLVNISRSILGALTVLSMFIAIQYITIGECSALKYSSPVWTCLMGFLILKERIPISLILALPLSFLGIILIAHPTLIVDLGDDLTVRHDNHNVVQSNTFIYNSSSSDMGNVTNDVGLAEMPTEQDPSSHETYFDRRWPGIAAALGSSLSLSASIIVLKFRKKTPISTNSFYMGMATMIVGLLIQVIIGFGTLPMTILEWFVHVCIGFFAYATQGVLQWALQYTPVGPYSVIRTFDIVIGFILGTIFLNDTFLWTSIVGSMLIMFVITMLIFNEYIESALKSSLNCCRNRSTSEQDCV